MNLLKENCSKEGVIREEDQIIKNNCNFISNMGNAHRIFFNYIWYEVWS